MAGAGWHDFVPGEVLTAANVQDYLQDQAVMKFASAAARAAALPSPSQGMMSFLNDTGVVETYYAAWNATTNPGGKVAGAGWYATDRNDGLVAIVPPTVAVSGGSATANSLGLISFSAVTSLSLNGAFTSAYENYLVLVKINAATANAVLRFRLRASGTDQTGTYNWGGAIGVSSGSTQGFNSTGAAFGALGDTSNQTTAQVVNEISFFGPQALMRTLFSSKIMFDNGTNVYGGAFGGSYQPTTQCDGISLFLSAAGNFSGTVQVFGYNS